MGDSRHSSPRNGGTQCPIPTAQQHIDSTPCRRTGPRRWLRAVTWAVTAGHHPKATATTLVVAEDLATRMDYDTGHVLYALDGMTARLGLSRSCITNHVRILRELGLLAWVQQGSRRNLRRALGLRGYAGTATVYAATIPPAFDEAMGHRIVGEGYEARVVVDYRTMPKPTDAGPAAAAGEQPEKAPHHGAPTSPERSSWTPSLTVVKESGQVQVESGFTTTANAAANHDHPTQKTTSSRPSGQGRDKTARRRTTVCGQTITPTMIRQARRLAPYLRARVNWLQKATHDQLSWILLDPIAWGWDEEQIVSWCAALGRYTHDGRPWRPRWPHRVLAKHLRTEHTHQQEQAAAERQQANLERRATAPTAEFIAACQTAFAPAGEESGLEATPVTRDELWRLREEAREDLSLVHMAIDLAGVEEATRLYGVGLVARARNQQKEGALA